MSFAALFGFYHIFFVRQTEQGSILNCSSQKVYQLIKNGDFEGVYKDSSRGRAWKVPEYAIYHYEDKQGRKYEQIITSSIQRSQVKNDYSKEMIPTA